MSDEFFDLIDDATGQIVGRATRRECHGNPKLLHRSVRVAVYHPDGKSLLLQKRSMSKDIFPGRWDMAVGGHVDSGETPDQAVVREMREELGLVSDLPLKKLFQLKVRNEIESENVQLYSTVCAGPFEIQEQELSEIRFFSFDELKKLLRDDPEQFTPLLVRELRILLEE
ncbi:MAG: NUDIX domain-containing protein [Lentisphaeria bacterium]|nr:NUDIX domain-containing protein [Lentisphaeria bacterium]